MEQKIQLWQLCSAIFDVMDRMKEPVWGLMYMDLRTRTKGLNVGGHSWEKHAQTGGLTFLRTSLTDELSTSDILQMGCLWFCFSQLLQQELDDVSVHWNSHYIRKSRHDTVAGRPNELFYLPECRQTRSYLQPVEEDRIADMSNYCHDYEEVSNYQEYFNTILTLGNFQHPTNWEEGLELYRQLLTIAVSWYTWNLTCSFMVIRGGQNYLYCSLHSW